MSLQSSLLFIGRCDALRWPLPVRRFCEFLGACGLWLVYFGDVSGHHFSSSAPPFLPAVRHVASTANPWPSDYPAPFSTATPHLAPCTCHAVMLSGCRTQGVYSSNTILQPHTIRSASITLGAFEVAAIAMAVSGKNASPTNTYSSSDPASLGSAFLGKAFLKT